MDRLDAMRTFVRVAELGNFSAVARQMGVARSVITRQVAALEARLGTRLMLRSTRKLSLTSAGTAYLEKCRVILNLVEAADSDAAATRAVARGNVRIGLPLSFGLKRLAPLLLEFADLQPAVSLEMDYTDRRADLVAEGVDLAIRITARLAPGDVARRLGLSRLLVVASPAYLARHGRPLRPADLANHECLAYVTESGRTTWSFEAHGREESVHVQGRLSGNNGDVLCEAAARGLGVTLQPDFIVEPYLADGRLEQVLRDFAPPELGIYALLPGGRHQPHRVRVLVDFLAERLRSARFGLPATAA